MAMPTTEQLTERIRAAIGTQGFLVVSDSSGRIKVLLRDEALLGPDMSSEIKKSTLLYYEHGKKMLICGVVGRQRSHEVEKVIDAYVSAERSAVIMKIVSENAKGSSESPFIQKAVALECEQKRFPVTV